MSGLEEGPIRGSAKESKDGWKVAEQYMILTGITTITMAIVFFISRLFLGCKNRVSSPPQYLVL